MPGVFLSLAKELSFLLVESLERGELNAAFAYGTSERPGLARTACNASVAVSDGDIFIRTHKNLWCVTAATRTALGK